MKIRYLLPFLISVALLLGLASLANLEAQGPGPPQPPLPPGERYGPWVKTPEDLWVAPGGYQPEMAPPGIAPQATGGPDDFGYTWDDSVPVNWIDATDGTDTGMSGSSWGQAVGPVSLPFPFKFYEDIYTNVYIAAAGYLSFTPYGFWPWQQSPLPSIQPPNNVIAPFWTVIYLEDIGPTGRVYYKGGGTAPDRYFVVEWFDVKGGSSSDASSGDETYRFEVILYENGDIVFQYHTMTYNDWRYYASIGIEDATGLGGLGYMDWTNYWDRYPASNTAIRFYRPPPSARVQMRPAAQGQFTSAGATVTFEQSIRNTGELGADTYDLLTTTTWPVGLFAADGTTPLSDTDSDGTVDTGSVAQGEVVTVTVKVTAPSGASVGDNNTASLAARSSLDTSKSKTATLSAAVPAPFAQAYYQDWAPDGSTDYEHYMDILHPQGQRTAQVTNDSDWAYYPAVAEAPNGNLVYAWYHSYSNANDYWVGDIEYAIFDPLGNVVRPISKVTDNGGATMLTFDYGPAVAAAPNGRLGVLWVHELAQESDSTWLYNDNIYFAVLDSAGNVVVAPTNLTNNTGWYSWDPPTYNVPVFWDPHIAATSDNRFVSAWSREHEESSGYVDDVYIAVRDTSGGEVKPITRFTFDTPGWDEGYWSPNLTPLRGGQALLTWERNSDYDIYYAVLDSAGNTVRVAANLVGDGSSSYDWRPDAAQLSNGKTVVAWTGGVYPNYRIRYAVLDAAYNRVAGPIMLTSPTSTGDGYVSVAADSAGHAILTWMDYYYAGQFNLYYALIDSSGAQVSPPMIFRTTQNMYILTSYYGYGNTSYSHPPAGVDGWVSAPSLVGGPPGGTAVVPVGYGNYGATATDVVLTATLDSALTYIGDTSGISPTVIGNDVVWNLPDLAFLSQEAFAIYVGVPSTTIGTRFPITLSLTSAGPETNPADNAVALEVMAAHQVFLPLTTKNW